MIAPCVNFEYSSAFDVYQSIFIPIRTHTTAERLVISGDIVFQTNALFELLWLSHQIKNRYNDRLVPVKSSIFLVGGKAPIFCK